jgi:hypothetical protein
LNPALTSSAEWGLANGAVRGGFHRLDEAIAADVTYKEKKLHDPPQPQHRGKMKLDYTVEEEYRTHLQKVWLQVMDTADLNRLKLSQKKKNQLIRKKSQVPLEKITRWG